MFLTEYSNLSILYMNLKIKNAIYVCLKERTLLKKFPEMSFKYHWPCRNRTGGYDPRLFCAMFS